MCNETGILEFLESRILGIPVVTIVTSRTRTCVQAATQCIWTKTGWSGVEQVHGDRILTYGTLLDVLW